MKFIVEHFGLPSPEPTALKDWYVKVLDGKVVFDNGQTPPLYFVEIGGSLLLEIGKGAFSLPQTGDNSLHGWRHLALQVPSIEAAQAELEKRGVVFTDPIKPAGGGGRVLFFRDADGNLLHFVERPAGSQFLKP